MHCLITVILTTFLSDYHRLSIIAIMASSSSYHCQPKVLPKATLTFCWCNTPCICPTWLSHIWRTPFHATWWRNWQNHCHRCQNSKPVNVWLIESWCDCRKTFRKETHKLSYMSFSWSGTRERPRGLGKRNQVLGFRAQSGCGWVFNVAPTTRPKRTCTFSSLAQKSQKLWTTLKPTSAFWSLLRWFAISNS